VATLLIVVACVLAPLGVVAVWARNQVTNTDRYVATVAPPASDPPSSRPLPTGRDLCKRPQARAAHRRGGGG
jgi:hypothetical protein